jgi:uncharacterized membrane protein YtjA (UPF0391 family)
VENRETRHGRGGVRRARRGWRDSQQGELMINALANLSPMMLAQADLGGLLWLGIVFFIIAIVAYVLGARGVAGMSAGIGRTLLFVFLVLAIIMVIVSLINRA